MTVSELIEELKKYDSETKVAKIDTYNYVVAINHVEELERAGNKFIRVC